MRGAIVGVMGRSKSEQVALQKSCQGVLLVEMLTGEWSLIYTFLATVFKQLYTNAKVNKMLGK